MDPASHEAEVRVLETFAELSRRTGVHERTWRKLAAAGGIQTCRIGKHALRVVRRSADEFLTQGGLDVREGSR
jgi:hypothetical protein